MIDVFDEFRFLGPEAHSLGTYHGQRVEAVSITLSLQHHAQLMDLSNLLLSQMAGMAILRLGRLRGEVIVVVLGIHIHGAGFYGE